MKTDLHTRQERMRQRQLAKAQRRADPVKYKAPTAPWNPINYREPVFYAGCVSDPSRSLPCIGGVYLLTESGRYYIGQSVDIYARFYSHRLKHIACKMSDPTLVVLAATTRRVDRTWAENARVRLRAEARFMAAAVRMGLPLTNTLGTRALDSLGAIPDVVEESERLDAALKTLC